MTGNNTSSTSTASPNFVASHNNGQVTIWVGYGSDVNQAPLVTVDPRTARAWGISLMALAEAADPTLPPIGT